MDGGAPYESKYWNVSAYLGSLPSAETAAGFSRGLAAFDRAVESAVRGGDKDTVLRAAFLRGVAEGRGADCESEAADAPARAAGRVVSLAERATASTPRLNVFDALRGLDVLATKPTVQATLLETSRARALGAISATPAHDRERLAARVRTRRQRKGLTNLTADGGVTTEIRWLNYTSKPLVVFQNGALSAFTIIDPLSRTTAFVPTYATIPFVSREDAASSPAAAAAGLANKLRVNFRVGGREYSALLDPDAEGEQEAASIGAPAIAAAVTDGSGRKSFQIAVFGDENAIEEGALLTPQSEERAGMQIEWSNTAPETDLTIATIALDGTVGEDTVPRNTRSVVKTTFVTRTVGSSAYAPSDPAEPTTSFDGSAFADMVHTKVLVGERKDAEIVQWDTTYESDAFEAIYKRHLQGAPAIGQFLVQVRTSGSPKITFYGPRAPAPEGPRDSNPKGPARSVLPILSNTLVRNLSAKPVVIETAAGPVRVPAGAVGVVVRANDYVHANGSFLKFTVDGKTRFVHLPDAAPGAPRVVVPTGGFNVKFDAVTRGYEVVVAKDA